MQVGDKILVYWVSGHGMDYRYGIETISSLESDRFRVRRKLTMYFHYTNELNHGAKWIPATQLSTLLFT